MNIQSKSAAPWMSHPYPNTSAGKKHNAALKAEKEKAKQGQSRT